MRNKNIEKIFDELCGVIVKLRDKGRCQFIGKSGQQCKRTFKPFVNYDTGSVSFGYMCHASHLVNKQCILSIRWQLGNIVTMCDVHHQIFDKDKSLLPRGITQRDFDFYRQMRNQVTGVNYPELAESLMYQLKMQLNYWANTLPYDLIVERFEKKLSKYLKAEFDA